MAAVAEAARDGEPVVVAGSLYLAGDVRAKLS
jgi:folylpolyglutamate synthase/dihydropteroate synthase